MEKGRPLRKELRLKGAAKSIVAAAVLAAKNQQISLFSTYNSLRENASKMGMMRSFSRRAMGARLCTLFGAPRPAPLLFLSLPEIGRGRREHFPSFGWPPCSWMDPPAPKGGKRELQHSQHSSSSRRGEAAAAEKGELQNCCCCRSAQRRKERRRRKDSLEAKKERRKEVDLQPVNHDRDPARSIGRNQKDLHSSSQVYQDAQQRSGRRQVAERASPPPKCQTA